ncbi:PBP1A family penicillin-binding protein [Sulfurimonas sp. HSL-1716]|uniref:penicillin-binding protein 1A n=1 Tax=Hydrocurvibacter sulfurireducens TaxID=3131937 RepID=UPI0031F92CC6
MKKAFISIFLLILISPFAVVGYYLTQYNYDLDKLINYKPILTTRIYDRNGEKIANIFNEEHRYYATFDEIPPRLIEALLAIEDTTFFEHHGVNFDAIFRALIKDIKAGKMVEGASTLTQQLVKNTLLTREKKISRKIKELIFSLKLERELSKEQILERYLNEVYLGHGYYGMKTAADGYFHKDLKNLTLKEMAMLVGLPKAPSFYSPTKNYEISLGRANRVIERMHSLGWIDDKTYEKATKEQPHVYDSTLTQNQAPFVVDEVLRELIKDFPDIKTGGYDIYTTIDLNMQKSGREALKYAYDRAITRVSSSEDSNDTNLTQLNGALVSIEPSSGDILALVGSVDYDKSPYNRATQGRRQPGSAFKPFIYQVAIDLGYSGATQLVDIAKTYEYEKDGEEMKWQPDNYEKNYKGLITLREALIHSRNLATINLVTDIGLNTILQSLESYGIKNLPHDLSLSLGSISLSPLELAQYYSSFANHGIQVEPILIKKVEKNSEVVFRQEAKRKYITSPEQTYLMTSILQDVVKRGTGRNARVRGIELAGKTGTTNNNVDAWFAGYSPSIETVVWFGNDDNTPMHAKETGGRTAAPAFNYFYKELLKSNPQVKRRFVKPEGVIEVKIGGETEYFTNTSKPPKNDNTEKKNEELIF